ncbi:MAG: ABC transporter permease [Coxiellaceae bacterium]|jgi:ABC-2 type transport system permease protein|nr:ABC transporter permease [Coxiellaceae bacterium]
MRSIPNIYILGVKELWSLWRDPIMLFLIVYTFTVAIYIAATAMPDSLNKASLAIVDEDGSPLSERIISAFYPPYFMPPKIISLTAVDPGMDSGDYTFTLDIPPNFQRNVSAGNSPTIQLNVDATRMSQAFTGSGYIQQIILEEINEFVQRYRGVVIPAVDIVLRARFNPNLTQSWFGSVMELVNHVAMVSIILSGAALIREREHGTIEHLLVMPVTPAEIMIAKIWSMGLVVLLATMCSLIFVIKGALHVPIEGSITLFLVGVILHLFATTSMGIFMGCMARSMPQFGLLIVLVLLPLEMLSGGVTPRESMPILAQNVMLVTPNTHFVSAAQAILFRSAGFDVVWPQFLALIMIGTLFFVITLGRFRKTTSRI